MGRAAMRTAVATVAAGALIALAGCGSSSKPAYCSDRTNLENSIKNLPSVTSSSGVSGLKSQINTIVSDANSVVSSAKSDFPSQTSAVKTSVDALQSAVKALPSSPSATQVAAIATRCGQRRELGQELHRTPASRSAADTSVRHGGSECLPAPLLGILALASALLDPLVALGGTTSATRTAGKQSDDECPRPGGTCALRCFRCWSRAARRWSRGRR